MLVQKKNKLAIIKPGHTGPRPPLRFGLIFTSILMRGSPQAAVFNIGAAVAMETPPGDDMTETPISMQVPVAILLRRTLTVLGLSIAAFLTGCTGGRHLHSYMIPTGGSVHHGRSVIADYKCGTCHTIPGIAGAHGVFGPPLNMMARRSYIAGNFPNTPDNLTHWVMAPTSMKPRTAMPDLGLSQQQARDVTAYLETLR